MPEVTVSTLADYSEAHELTGYCNPCDRGPLELPWATLAESFGWDARLVSVRRKLTCSECGEQLTVSVSPARKIDYR